MIVKQHSFKVPAATLYGVAGGVFGLATIGLMLQSQLAPDSHPSCTDRYAQAGMFALERSSGALLDAAELQSKLAGREWGILHNVAIKPDDTASRKVAMTVAFKPGGRIDKETRRAASGIGFKWRPGHLRKASAACLSYAVKIPENFKFARGGTLPGLFGASKTAAPDAAAVFSTRMRWLTDGKVGVQPVTAKRPAGQLMALAEKWLKFPRGRWVKIEQEVILNTPGQHDGTLRIWIDGRLHLNLATLNFRKDAGTGFSGVIANTHYANGRDFNWAPAPAKTEVKLSPLIIRWN